jgi:hypothetical protein
LVLIFATLTEGKKQVEEPCENFKIETSAARRDAEKVPRCHSEKSEESLIGLKPTKERFFDSLRMTRVRGFSAACKAKVNLQDLCRGQSHSPQRFPSSHKALPPV